MEHQHHLVRLAGVAAPPAGVGAGLIGTLTVTGACPRYRSGFARPTHLKLAFPSAVQLIKFRTGA